MKAQWRLYTVSIAPKIITELFPDKNSTSSAEINAPQCRFSLSAGRDLSRTAVIVLKALAIILLIPLSSQKSPNFCFFRESLMWGTSGTFFKSLKQLDILAESFMWGLEARPSHASELPGES